MASDDLGLSDLVITVTRHPIQVICCQLPSLLICACMGPYLSKSHAKLADMRPAIIYGAVVKWLGMSSKIICKAKCGIVGFVAI